MGIVLWNTCGQAVRSGAHKILWSSLSLSRATGQSLIDVSRPRNRPGQIEFPRHRFRSGGRGRRGCSTTIRPVLPGGRPGRAGRRGHLAHDPRCGSTSPGGRRRWRRRTARHRRHGHRQSARDDGAMGRRHRCCGPPRHRLARPPHRTTLRRHAQGRRRRRHPRHHGPGDRPLFLQHQARLAARPTRYSQKSGSGQAAFRHRRQLPHLALHQ